MMRAAILAAALSLVLALVAPADEPVGYWTDEPNSPAKVIDFVVHNTGDGLLRAITHDGKIYRRAAGPTGVWSLECTIDPGTTATPPGAKIANWQLDPAVKAASWPQLVSFGGSLYAVKGYISKYYDAGGSSTSRMFPEYRVLKIDGGTSAAVLQVRAAESTAWQCGPVWNFYTPRNNTLTGGHLFVNGATLVWGGGGAKWINPVQAAQNLDVAAGAFTNGANVMEFVYSSGDGTTWDRLGGTGRTHTDDYGQPVPTAMPEGYRYSHVVPFKTVLYDCYGYYDKDASFTFHPHTNDIATEPWSWFLMANDKPTDPANATRLYRIGFNRKGDKNNVYAISAVGGNWSTSFGFAAGSNGGPNATGSAIYWRGCAAISDNRDAPADLHNGLYCTYSQGPAGGYQSGVYRYFPDDGGGNRTPGWSRVCAVGDARVFTGGICVQKSEAIYVGTSTGVKRRGIGEKDVPNPGDNPPPAP